MVINFHPDSDKPELISATFIYRKIWQEEGDKIVDSYLKIAGLNFTEKEFNAIIYEGVSRSVPLCFRASYSDEQKLATIIHELGHRLLIGNGLPQRDNITEIHKDLNLVLYDVWTDLYGQEFADRNVEVESARTSFYKEAWEWALAMDKQQRQEAFKKLRP